MVDILRSMMYTIANEPQAMRVKAITMTTFRPLTLENILDNDAAEATAAAEATVISESCELAPLSYAALRALRGTSALGEALAQLADELVRPQAVRFLVERKAATGVTWGWGDVDDIEARFRRVIDATRREQLARRIGAAQAAKIGEMLSEEARPAPAPATSGQSRYILRLILDLSGSAFEAEMEAALSAAGVSTSYVSWAEALEVAQLTIPVACRLIAALLRLRDLDERGCDGEVVAQAA
jgi:hypothetical protein